MDNERDDAILLDYLDDKSSMCERRNILTYSYFLDERQQAISLAHFKKEHLNIEFWGGFAGADRRLAVFLPEYLTLDDVVSENQLPLAYVRAEFIESDHLSHRDFLGSLIGAGVRRESIGDILVGDESCDFIVEKSVVPYLMSNLEHIGRTKPKISEITAEELSVPVTKTKTIKDTVASLRLDSIVASGFSMGRDAAASLIKGGKVTLNYLDCIKPDRAVAQGDVISARGRGKCRLTTVGGNTKKGRISVVIDKFV